MDLPMPDHEWNEIRRAGRPDPVAYACAHCGERRPRGRAIVEPGKLSDERRDELEQAGFEVVESGVSPANQILLLDGRFTPGHEDERLWCPDAPRVAA